MIGVCVCAHPARLDRAEALAAKVGGVVVVDEEPDDAPVLLRSARTHDRAWRAAAALGHDWSVVLEDDAVPVDGFTTALNAALSASGRALVSLYLGDAPMRQRASQAAKRAEESGASWIDHYGLLWGVGVALPTDAVGSMLESVRIADRRYLNPYDERLSIWANGKLPIRYVWPSLVDHLDDVSLIGTRHGKRRAQRVGTRETYDSVTVTF